MNPRNLDDLMCVANYIDVGMIFLHIHVWSTPIKGTGAASNFPTNFEQNQGITSEEVSLNKCCCLTHCYNYSKARCRRSVQRSVSNTEYNNIILYF